MGELNTPLSEQLNNILNQVGHPDYSLREMLERLYALLPDLMHLERLSARQPSPSAREHPTSSWVRVPFKVSSASGYDVCYVSCPYAPSLTATGLVIKEAALIPASQGLHFDMDARYGNRRVADAEAVELQPDGSTRFIGVPGGYCSSFKADTLGSESVAQVDGYGNGAPDAPSPAATDPTNESAAEERKKEHSSANDAGHSDRRCKPAEPSLTEVSASAADPAPEARELSAEAPEEVREWVAHMDLHLTEHDLRHAGLALRAAWPAVRAFMLSQQQALARAQDSVRVLADNIKRQANARERAEAELAKVREALDKRPRTEFVAVGWWDGRQALFETGLEPEMGALLFRPTSEDRVRATLASAPSAKEGQPDEQSGEWDYENAP